MKNVFRVLGILTVFLLTSCSTVKVTDVWEGSKSLDLDKKKILVVSKTDKKSVRLRFENNLTSLLNENNLTAISSFQKFPDLDPMKKTDNDKALVKRLLENDIQIVILSQLIDSKNYRETIETNTPIARFHTYYDPRYRRFRGFYTYHNNYTYHEYTGIKHIIETIIYDLTLPKNEQLVSIISLEVDNPKSISTTSSDFAKQIVKNIMP